MSLRAPQTKEEQKFQHCNYGYDTSKYKSFDDCMKNYYKFNKSNLPDKLPNQYNQVSQSQSTTTQGVSMKLTCNDGTTSSGNFSNVDSPCKNNGGVKSLEPITSKEPIYYILVTAGVLVAGYFAYKKFKK
jgi:hypothetical protein